jgi:DNA-binding protein H-NS
MAMMLVMAPEAKMTVSELLATLKDLPIEDLDKVIAAAEQERESKREAGRKVLLDEVRVKAGALGLSLSALFEGAADEDRTSSKSTRSPVLAKYRHPETGEAWSGRGSTPAWLKRLEEQGRHREEFALGRGA